MKTRTQYLAAALLTASSLILAGSPLQAQQPDGVPQSDRWVSSHQYGEITGEPGSPSATVTLTGEQIPPPPQKFEGKIERIAQDSKPYWPARIEPPENAPNVLLIMTDDSGFGVPSTFGGESSPYGAGRSSA